MIKKLGYTIIILSMLFGMLGVVAPAYALGANSTGLRALKGTIVAINTKTHTLTISRLKGAPVQVIVAKNTLIRRNGKPGRLAKLHVGDKTSLRYNPVNHHATVVNCTPGTYVVHGTIQAVNTDANTITITPHEGGNSVMLSVDDNTTIQHNGSDAALGDLVVTDNVEATYDSASMLASDIQADTNSVQIQGTILAINTDANTLVVAPASDSLLRKSRKNNGNVMLSVDDSTTIERNGASVGLADLQVGDTVAATYNSVTLLASDVSAQTSNVEIQGTISAVDTDANTVTITPGVGSLKSSSAGIRRDSADIVLNVDDNTVITRNGDYASLSDLQAGDSVDATYDPSSMLAVQINAQTTDAQIQGTISAIDTDANTVTITPGGDAIIKGCDADVTLTVDGSTVILRSDTVVALTDLQVGDSVGATYNSMTMIASVIEANDVFAKPR